MAYMVLVEKQACILKKLSKSPFLCEEACEGGLYMDG